MFGLDPDIFCAAAFWSSKEFCAAAIMSPKFFLAKVPTT